MAITFGRAAHNSSSSPSGSIAVTITINAGETGVLCWHDQAGTGGITSISGGGTWTKQTSNEFNNVNAELWTTDASAATGASSVTINFNGAPAAVAVIAATYIGVSAIGITATPVGQTAGNPTISLTTQDNDNWVIACFATDDGSDGPFVALGAGVTLRDDALISAATDAHVGLTDNTSASPGSVTNGITYPLTGGYSIVALELRSTGGGTPAVVGQITQGKFHGNPARARRLGRVDASQAFFADRIYPVPDVVVLAAQLRPETIVLAKKRRKQKAKSFFTEGATRAPFTKRNASIIKPVKRRKRASEITLLRAKISATIAAIAPRKRVVFVESVRRRKRTGDVILTTGARRAQIVLTVVPEKQVIVVKPARRRRRAGDASLVTGARRVGVVPEKQVIVVRQTKRRKRAGEVIFTIGARRATVAVIVPKQHIILVKQKKRARRLPTTQSLAALFAFPATPHVGAIPFVLVLPKKRRKRQGESTVVRAKRSQAPAAVRPPKTRTITLVDRRRHRIGEIIFVRGAKRAGLASIRPSRPITLVLPKKRRKRAAEAISLHAGRLATILAVIPEKQVTIVRSARRRKRTAEAILLRAGRLAILAIVPDKQVIVVRSARRRKRTGDVMLVFGRKSQRKSRSPLVLPVPAKRKRRHLSAGLWKAPRIQRLKRQTQPIIVDGRRKRLRKQIRLFGKRIIAVITPLPDVFTITVIRDIFDLSPDIIVNNLDVDASIYVANTDAFIRNLVTDVSINEV